jgi:hypothetical protein
MGHNIVDLLLIGTAGVLLHETVSRKHVHIPHVFGFHFVEVDEHVVLLGVLFAEVQHHAGVDAVLEARLRLLLLKVKALVEVGNIRVSQLARGKAVLENHTAGRLLVHVLVILVSVEGSHDIPSHGVFGGEPFGVDVGLCVHYYFIITITAHSIQVGIHPSVHLSIKPL